MCQRDIGRYQLARTPDLERKQDLLDDVTNYVRSNGVSALSLRPLAKGVSTSPRNLLYHFGSSSEMIGSIIDRSLQIDCLGVEKALEDIHPAAPSKVLLTIWNYIASHHNAIRLYVDISSVGQATLNELEDRIEQLTKSWRDAISNSMIANGTVESDAREFADLTLSTLWGSIVNLGSSADGSDSAEPPAISRLMRILDSQTSRT